MSGHDEIKGILIDILRIGLLRIRAFGYSGLAEACSIEADQLHKLPDLINSLNAEGLAYYYDIERPAFLRATTPDVGAFELLWERLAKLLHT